MCEDAGNGSDARALPLKCTPLPSGKKERARPQERHFLSKAPCLSACGPGLRAMGGPYVWREVGCGFVAPEGREP